MTLRHHKSLKMKILMCEISFMSFTVLWLLWTSYQLPTYRNSYYTESAEPPSGKDARETVLCWDFLEKSYLEACGQVQD